MRHGTYSDATSRTTVGRPTVDDRARLDALIGEMLPARAVGDAADAFRDVARELAPLVDMWQRLLDGHTRTADGYCTHQECGRGGYGTPCAVHPCAVRVLAEHARAYHRGDT